MSVIRSVKGTRDFYPREMSIRSWLYATIRQVSESFGYQEYDASFLEPIELYAAKSGDELVKEQAFVFPDRSGELITLRPELTPSLVRMVAQRQRQLTFPLRWWSFGPFWRYERPQRGRSREFFQWNIDLIGVDSPEADAELAAVAASFFQKVGLRPDEVQVLVNNRRLMNAQLESLGIPLEQHPAVFKFIDRKEKLSVAEWESYAAEIGLSADQVKCLRDLLANERLWEQSEEMQRFFATVDALGVNDYVRFAPYIIRGLDYYTGTVFEARDREDTFRAILGGGRYDNLMEAVGGAPLPGVGFAMGDVVITLVLEHYNRIPDVERMGEAQVLVTVFDEPTWLPAYAFAAELRRQGLRVACYPQPAKMPKQFKYADRIGAKVAVIIGPDEKAQDKVSVKNLRTREQVSLPKEDAIRKIFQWLESGEAS